MAQAEIIIVDDALFPEAVEVYNAIFRPKQDADYFKRHLLGHYNPLVLIARLATNGENDSGGGGAPGRPVGLWIGYEERPGLFRHWLGAVHPDFRREGIARQLQEAEHAWASEHGYTAVRCEATNRQKEYVTFALSTGFDIIGLRYEGERADNMVVFEKLLDYDGDDTL